MVPIRQDFIPAGKRNRPGHPMVPRYITIHDTGNASVGATAAMHASYVKNHNILAGWHFTVDDREIWQHLPLNENGWHATDGTHGVGNRQSIGIEICMNQGANRAKAEEHAAWLVAKLIRETPTMQPFPDCVKQHNHWYPVKNCPQILRGRPGGWAGFLKQIEGFLRPASFAYKAVSVAHSEADFFAADRLVRWTFPGDKTVTLVKTRPGYAEALAELAKEGTEFLFIVGGGVKGFENIPTKELVDLSGANYFETVANVRTYLGR